MRYDYQCSDCEHIQEEEHPMSGPTKKLLCKKCGGAKLARTFQTTNAIIFKGDDWATNKYR